MCLLAIYKDSFSVNMQLALVLWHPNTFLHAKRNFVRTQNSTNTSSSSNNKSKTKCILVWECCWKIKKKKKKGEKHTVSNFKHHVNQKIKEKTHRKIQLLTSLIKFNAWCNKCYTTNKRNKKLLNHYIWIRRNYLLS